jgi:OmcA/MtrC family decaheme c-type cytochrome
MRVPFSYGTAARIGLPIAFVVGSAVLLSNSDRPVYTAMDKAYYADAAAINFVRPGLVLKIQSASIADDGTIKVRFTATDPKGLPLDKDGVTTPGTFSPRIMIATIPAGQTQYVSYVTRKETDPVSGRSSDQASYDSGGTFTTNAVGDYTYTFKNKAPSGFDKHATHTIGMWATRDLSEFDMTGIVNNSSTTFSFVPDGSPVTTTRDVVRTQSCNKCHDPLSAHDERQGVDLCVLCHTPQTVDAETGNTVDFKVMIHKIHAGSSLPSVKAGGKYQIVGYRGSVADYSTVVFPADTRNCTFCHEQNTGAAQATNYLTKPTRATCGSCHDDVNFATGQNHLVEISDNQCASCHQPQGELEFDASIIGAHTIPTNSKQLPGLVLTILSVTNTAAGQKPTVTFSVKDKSGNPITSLAQNSGSLVLAGPTTDYATVFSESYVKAQGSNGIYTYTFNNAIPAGSKGTWTIGLEGYRNVTINPGTTQALAVRDAAVNVQYNFSVDGSPVQPRRQVVSLDKCNMCHASLSLHGGNRNRIEECVLCHNPNANDATYRPAAQAPAQTIDFSYMIHRIHTGEEGTTEYTIYGYHGSVNDFTEVRFPGDRRDCAVCHVNNSQQPPLAPGLLNVQNQRGYLNPMGPVTAACTGCHTTMADASHALSNTTDKLGEACAACHASTSEFSVPKVHAR